MMFYKTFFGPTPKSLKAIDIDFPGRKTLAMVDLQMAVKKLLLESEAILLTENLYTEDKI